jgi:23S rRNA pseudouridine2605 synthase
MARPATDRRLEPQRLQKILAAAGIASRRGSEALIAAGRVTVDGRPAVLGERVDPTTSEISVDGRPIATATGAHAYLALHKPLGVTSTVRDRHAARTVMDLLPEDLRGSSRRIFPVGRLDQDSEGLLLLTDDGAWAERVLHPRYEVEREYAIGVHTPLTPDQVAGLEAGISLDEGLAALHHLRVATAVENRRLVAILDPQPPPLIWYRATLRQGWKRQLRRMFGAVDAPIARLVRVRIGPLWLGNMPSAAVRRLTGAEVRALGATLSGR